MWESPTRLPILRGPKVLSPVLHYQKKLFKVQGFQVWAETLRKPALVLSQSCYFCLVFDFCIFLFFCVISVMPFASAFFVILSSLLVFALGNSFSLLVERTEGSTPWRWDASLPDAACALNRRRQ